MLCSLQSVNLRPFLARCHGRGLLSLALTHTRMMGLSSPYTPPPPPGFLLWSRASTWGLSGGAIPGVGSAAGSNATIPCDTAVLLDVPSVRLHTLNIRGMLK